MARRMQRLSHNGVLKTVLILVLVVVVVSTAVSALHLTTTTVVAPPIKNKSTPPLAVDEGHNAPIVSANEYDLDRMGSTCVLKATTLLQIHHGIYKVVSALEGGNTLQFAFKTECRPAAKWHGQQGWGEIAIHNLLALWEEFDQSRDHDGIHGGSRDNTYRFHNTVPVARGGVVWVSEKTLQTIVHRDQCGLISAGQVNELSSTLRSRKDDISQRAYRDLEKYSVSSEKLLPLVGVILTWIPDHDDAAIPSRQDWLDAFTLRQPSGSLPSEQTGMAPASKPLSYFSKGDLLAAAGNPGSSGKLNDARLEVQRQLSDVMMFDYLFGNEDRETKNWFRDTKTGRYILMDNGFVFSGRNYKESICSDYPALLACPPILRELTKSSQCRIAGAAGATAGLCTFRPETVTLIKSIQKAWWRGGDLGLSKKWIESVESDVLMTFLTSAYAKNSTASFDTPLARVRDVNPKGGCAVLVKAFPNPGLAATRLADTPGINLIAAALGRRMEKLLLHVEKCVSKYGKHAVYSRT